MIENKILALKYRPQEFKDLIGQEVISKTILNAIKLNKTPNAYLLTGIRGVGKTTTARLIAKALNCLKNDEKNINCSTKIFCKSCDEIVNSNHIDVLEMDAASKTGIDDIRELIENSKYSPTSAKYKIFIIDEVHMLSKQAFNGLLKTLEEPPPKLKFILATTEVKKIPVTILSRCQRFDLKRVKSENLFMHLKEITKKENGVITDKALNLIVRASEGSVRDAISLLDRALVLDIEEDEKQIQDYHIREMLGVADKSRLLLLFKEILDGKEEESLASLKELIDLGVEAKYFLNDILELLYLFSRRVNLGKIEKDLMLSEKEIELIDKYSKDINMQDLGLFWQLTIKTLDDINIVENENLALEMYVMQMLHLKNIDTKDLNLAQDIQVNSDLEIKSKNGSKIQNNEKDKESLKIKTKPMSQLKNTNQIQIKKDELEQKVKINKQTSKSSIKNLEDLIQKSEKEKELELKYDLERNVNLVKFEKGKIDISFNEKLSKNFVKLLSEKLLFWTGERWIISLSKHTGEKTIYEKKIENNVNLIEEVKDNEATKKMLETFPDAKITKVTEDTDA